MKSKSTWKEKSEKEVRYFLELAFGAENIGHDPKVNSKKADFLVKGINVYIEVHAVKDITGDLREETPRSKGVTLLRLKKNSEKKILDRIANKILHECEQLPDGTPNVLFTKTEGIFVSPDDVIDALIGRPFLIVHKATMNATEQREQIGFRTDEELNYVLEKISAVIAYEQVCEHGKLRGIIGNNKNNAKVPLDDKTYRIFSAMLCEKCMPSA